MTAVSNGNPPGLPRAGSSSRTGEDRGSSPSLTFLGIQLDLMAICLSLPAEKLEKLQAMVESVCEAKVIRDVHAFNSLLGHLFHTATVCLLDRAFLNYL